MMRHGAFEAHLLRCHKSAKRRTAFLEVYNGDEVVFFSVLVAHPDVQIPGGCSAVRSFAYLVTTTQAKT